jgi:hypothetical protein
VFRKCTFPLWDYQSYFVQDENLSLSGTASGQHPTPLKKRSLESKSVLFQIYRYICKHEDPKIVNVTTGEGENGGR